MREDGICLSYSILFRLVVWSLASDVLIGRFLCLYNLDKGIKISDIFIVLDNIVLQAIYSVC